MKIEPLLEKGYFPKELPPAFTTKYFAENFHSINDLWNRTEKKLITKNKELYRKKYKTSRCIKFSLPKRGFSRRDLEIPNPFHHSILCKTICDNWKNIETFFQKSKISLSRPIINTGIGRRIIPFKDFPDVKKECLIVSYDKLFELKADISWFYPTLYTHTIPWALHGKKEAKKNPSDKLFGNKLDKNVRNCKYGQTTGIPIGPDTSFVIAELVACGIDLFLQEKIESIRGYRFYDDLFLYFSSREDAEKGLKNLQFILSEYQLSLNEAKTNITRFPSTFDENWVVQLHSFKFRSYIKKKANREKEQKTDIERYFRLAFDLAHSNPENSVLGYALTKFAGVPIMDENWDLFESLILKSALLDPLILPQVIQLLVAYDELVSRDKISNLVKEIIKIHGSLGHSFETSWALWLAKTFNIKIDEIAQVIFDSNDVVSILIALDLKSENLIDPAINLSSITEELTEDSLFEEKWLLTYESINQGWLIPEESDPLETNEYFKILKDCGIKFYDKDVKVESIKIKGRKEMEKEEQIGKEIEKEKEVEIEKEIERIFYHAFYY
jgi:hypothetical protein